MAAYGSACPAALSSSVVKRDEMLRALPLTQDAIASLDLTLQAPSFQPLPTYYLVADPICTK